MIYLELFWSFFQIGMFSIGGGYAAMPLIQNQAVDIHSWLTMTQFADIMTIAEMTPGPIAINSATFVGIRVAGLPGAIIATMGCVFPSCVVVMILAYIYYRFRGLDIVQGVLSGLRPAVIAMIASAGVSLLILNVLTALALYRKRDERWRERLTAALDTAAEYRFIRTVSVYGTAVLPLLEALDWDGDKAWHKRLLAAARTQAAFYPHFLAPRLAPGEELTPTELQILHLLCADKSNAEIAQIMDVKLPTVKTHVSHILDKLDVKRRAEAKTAAKKLHLVPEDL